MIEAIFHSIFLKNSGLTNKRIMRYETNRNNTY